jgi:hypothetical protein
MNTSRQSLEETMKLHSLSARTVATLTKPGRHADGGNLYGRQKWEQALDVHMLACSVALRVNDAAQHLGWPF